jgi:methyltransferase (TIGR00027 family)
MTARLGSLTITLLLLLLECLVGAVEPGLPSRTAVEVTLHRAIGAKNPDPQFRNPDYMAARFLGPKERALLIPPTQGLLDLDYSEAVDFYVKNKLAFLLTEHLLRTRHIDEALLGAVRGGARQVVNLGAGLDSRAYRFTKELLGVQTFEVDYPPTQEYKKLRLGEILGSLPGNVRFVPMDFTRDDLLTQLKKSGYREEERTFFIWEGVT